MRTIALALVLGATALTGGLATATAANADTAATPVDPPSSCRPANHRATVTPGDSSAGHRHYRVTLTAAPGYAPCALDGTPGDVVFLLNGSPNGVTAAPSGQAGYPVPFAPGEPVHFDIQAPDGPGGVSTEGLNFSLPGVAGQDNATGYLVTAPGTQVGPIQPGA